MINERPRKVLTFTLLFEERPGDAVEFSAILPDLSGEALNLLSLVETLWAAELCTELPVAAYAINLLNYACESITSKTGMIDGVRQGHDPVKLRKSRNEKNRKLADAAGEKTRSLVALILEVPDGRRSDYLFPGLLAILHEKLKDLWRTAREIAKAAQWSRDPKRRKEWESEVKVFFQGRGFSEVEEDLINRLEPAANWPDNLAVTLARHGAGSKAYDIALEHAARLSAYPGYSAYSLTIRQLKTHLKESQRWLKSLNTKHGNG